MCADAIGLTLEKAIIFALAAADAIQLTMVAHILDLPLDAQLHLLDRLDAKTLSAAERVCTSLRALSRQEGCTAWRTNVHRRWGQVTLPRDGAWSTAAARALLPIWDGPEQPPANWRELFVYLETVVRMWICVSVRKAVELLKQQGIIKPAIDGEGTNDTSWHGTLRRLLTWVPLNERRRIAAFVCADWQPSATLARFLSPLPVTGDTPVVALRALLLRFPFLPIDAGAGADRVIGWFSRAWVVQNAVCLETLGIGLGAGLGAGGRPMSAAGTANSMPAVVESDSDSEDDAVGFEGGAALPPNAPPETASILLVPHAAPTASAAASLGLTEAEFKAARDAVYTLIYSVIMLNTDLHNPAISPKIQPDEYVRSVHRCVPLSNVPDDALLDIYTSIATHPLQIAPSVNGVHTTIRCSEVADDTESGPTFSVYSALPQRAAAAASGAATSAAASAATSAAASAATSAAGAAAAAAAAVAAAAAAAGTAHLHNHAAGNVAHGGVVIGGGTPIIPGRAHGIQNELPAIDWTVAYWNVVDACRTLRRKTARLMVPETIHRRAPLVRDVVEAALCFAFVRLAPALAVIGLAWKAQSIFWMRV